jgi:hypothetical protein
MWYLYVFLKTKEESKEKDHRVLRFLLYPTKDSWQFFFGSLNQVASEKKIGLQTMDDDRHQLIAIAHMTFTVKWHKNDKTKEESKEKDHRVLRFLPVL